jgi:NitT/TauT family transport system ATP-binding protein
VASAAGAKANGGAAGEPRELVVEGVAKDFHDARSDREVRALQGIDMKVRPGEFVTLIGPSGCGKSTLLTLIAGFEAPSQGVIRLGDRQITRSGPDRVMVFQDYALFPWRNTIENVEFGLQIQGVPKSERRRLAEEYLRLVGLSHVATRPIYKLSGGMRQRVALARALVLKPAVLLMDEPFAALDAQQRTLMQRELARIWTETGQTIIFVTHSLEEALFLSDRILLMETEPGRIALNEEVTLPRPRDITGDDFNDLKRRLGVLLEREVSEAETRRQRELEQE